jgi:cytochrome b
MAENKRLVWDLPLRLFHWLLAVSIAASWATAEAGFDWMQVHFYLGYWTIGLVLFRVLWGFIGPRHARFSSFLGSPAAIFRYLKGLFSGSAVHTVGHNPAGGLMVIVMLLLVALQAGTGLFASDDIVWSGPYNPAVSGATAERLTSLHHANFNWILATVALHILAIAFYGVVKKQNLAVAMLTGMKPATLVPEHEAITHSQLTKAFIAIVISGGAVWWLVNAAPPPPDNFF